MSASGYTVNRTPAPTSTRRRWKRSVRRCSTSDPDHSCAGHWWRPALLAAVDGNDRTPGHNGSVSGRGPRSGCISAHVAPCRPSKTKPVRRSAGEHEQACLTRGSDQPVDRRTVVHLAPTSGTEATRPTSCRCRCSSSSDRRRRHGQTSKRQIMVSPSRQGTVVGWP